MVWSLSLLESFYDYSCVMKFICLKFVECFLLLVNHKSLSSNRQSHLPIDNNIMALTSILHLYWLFPMRKDFGFWVKLWLEIETNV
jgi:hypothetical protein